MFFRERNYTSVVFLLALICTLFFGQAMIAQTVPPKPVNIEEVKLNIGYPDDARDKGVTGEVIVKLLVDEKGKVLKHEIVQNPDQLLVDGVVPHLKELEFTPAKVDGEVSKSWVNVPFKFTLVDVSKKVFEDLDEIAANQNDVMLVDLSNGSLEEFPIELLLCTELRQVNLSQNQIEEVPELIRILEKLAIIDLSGNPIRDIPDDLLNLPSLEVLVLDASGFSPERIAFINEELGDRIQWNQTETSPAPPLGSEPSSGQSGRK